MTVRKARLLLTARNDPAALARAAKAAVADAAPPAGLTLGLGLRTPGDPIAGSGHGQAIGPAPEGFEVLIEAIGEDPAPGALAEALAPVLEAVAGHADLARSAAIEGVHHLLADTPGPCMMVFALRRPARMSREAFFDYWANKHGPMIAAGFRNRGSYYQLHGDEAGTRALAERFGMGVRDFDGHAGGWLREPEALSISMRRDAAAVALEDERRFIDHPRSMLLIYAVDPAV